eukprot:jgi/Mesvir1/8233/Mv12516-RA.3
MESAYLTRSDVTEKELELPQSVLEAVFSFLPARDVAIAACVCTLWRACASSPLLWENLCRRRWPGFDFSLRHRIEDTDLAGPNADVPTHASRVPSDSSSCTVSYWRSVYLHKDSADRDALWHLDRMPHPVERSRSLHALRALGDDVAELLERCVASGDGRHAIGVMPHLEHPPHAPCGHLNNATASNDNDVASNYKEVASNYNSVAGRGTGGASGPGGSSSGGGSKDFDDGGEGGDGWQGDDHHMHTGDVTAAPAGCARGDMGKSAGAALSSSSPPPCQHSARWQLRGDPLLSDPKPVPPPHPVDGVTRGMAGVSLRTGVGVRAGGGARHARRGRGRHGIPGPAGGDDVDDGDAVDGGDDDSEGDGDDAAEVLWRPFLGRQYYARRSLEALHVQACAREMQRVLAGQEGPSDPLEDGRLLRGAIIIAKLMTPGLDASTITRKVDHMTALLEARLCADAAVRAQGRASLRALQVLNELLFGTPRHADVLSILGRERASPASSSTAHVAPSSAHTRSSSTSSAHFASLYTSPVGRATGGSPAGARAGWSAPHAGDVGEWEGIGEEGGLGFVGNESDYYNPNNSLLDQVLASGKGIPISLALLHAVVGRRCGLPMAMVPLPFHFLTKMVAASHEVFVDVFNGGSMGFHDEEAPRSVLDTHALDAHPLSSVLLRMCGNLITLYRQRGHPDKLLRMLHLALVVAPDNMGYRFQRAKACMAASDYDGALDDLRAMMMLSLAAAGARSDLPAQRSDLPSQPAGTSPEVTSTRGTGGQQAATGRDATAGLHAQMAGPQGSATWPGAGQQAPVGAAGAGAGSSSASGEPSAAGAAEAAATGHVGGGPLETLAAAMQQQQHRQQQLAAAAALAATPVHVLYPTGAGARPQNMSVLHQMFEHALLLATQEKLAADEIKDPRSVRFRVGDVIQHGVYGFRGVIVGWDAACVAEDEDEDMNVDRLVRDRRQPFYYVLVDWRDRPRQMTYVAEENILVDASLAPIHNEELGMYMEALVEGVYVPNPFLRSKYRELPRPVASHGNVS